MHGINVVPTFIIEDIIIVGTQPYEIFKKVINKVLDEKSRVIE